MPPETPADGPPAAPSGDDFYRTVGRPLLEEATGRLRGGAAVALLGPRNVGKRHTLRRLHDHLLRDVGGRLAQVQFLEGAAGDADGTCAGSCGHAAGAVERLPAAPAAVAAWLDARPAAAARPDVLLVSNPDALPAAAAADLLRSLAGRARDGRLAVVFAGGIGLRDLLADVRPDWPGMARFVLGGFDRDEFRSLTAGYLRWFASPGGACPNGAAEAPIFDTLYERSGGSPHLLRLLLWAALDQWAAQGGDVSEPQGVAAVTGYLAIAQVPWNHYFRYVTTEVEQRPECWPVLEQLVRDRPVPVPDPGPTDLELIGAAVREKCHLRLPGSVLAEFLRTRYTPRRLADLYAARGNWAVAFERYRKLPPGDWVRPSPGDPADVGAVARALEMSLYAEVAQGAEAVRRQFVGGCTHALDVPDVTFWVWEEGPRRQWDPAPGSRPAGHPADYVKLLPRPPLGRPEVTAADWPLVVRLPALGHGPGAAVVGCPTGPAPGPRHRRLLRDLTDHFLAAYTQAAEGDRARERQKAAAAFGAMAGIALDALAADAPDPRGLFMRVGPRLRKVGYRRVVFSLVDPAGDFIRGAWEDSDDPHRKLSRLINYPLSGEGFALHTEVVRTGTSRVVRDTTTDPAADREVIAATRWHTGAIVALREPGGEVLGTLLVEREDGLVPAPDEVGWLEALGGQVGIALAAAEYAGLVGGTLDRIPEPVVVFDRRRRLRYANPAAARYMTEVEPGWRRAGEAPGDNHLMRWVKGDIGRQLQPQIEASLTADPDRPGRLVSYRHVSDGEKEHDIAVYTDRVVDRAGARVGAMCFSRDVSPLYRGFEALRQLYLGPAATPFPARVAAATRALGHPRGVLYHVEDDGRVTVGGASYGLPPAAACRCPVCTTPPGPPADPGQPGWEAWLCAAGRKPVVFRRGAAEQDGTTEKTDRGLEVVTVGRPVCPAAVARAPGEVWVEFPLLGAGRTAGRFVLDCAADYRPEDFTCLTVLCGIVSEIFVARTRWEQILERELGDNAARTIREVFHHLGTNLAAFNTILTGYRQVAEQSAGEVRARLARWNDRLDQAHRRLHDMVRGTGRHVMTRATEWARADLGEVVRSALAGFPPPTGQVRAADPTAAPLDMDMDRPRLEAALVQLFNNAEACHHEPEKLQLTVTVFPVVRGGRPWVRVAVADNGPGVAPEVRERLFDPFFSQRPTGSRGHGFGLFFVRQVALDHGGSVRLDPDYSPGACFVLELPRDRSGPAAATTPQEPS